MSQHSHAPHPHVTQEERQQAAQFTSWVSVGINLVLTVMQLAVGIWAKSQSLIADAIHTLSDIVADFVVLLANKHSHKAADEDHPYGHHRYENAASLVLGGILLSVGIGILWSAAEKLQHPETMQPVHIAALWAALFTLAAKEGLFRYVLRVAQRVRSSMLIANAWHARSDAASSLVVAAGIGGNLLGFTFLDSLAAALVGFMIARMGWQFAWSALSDLMDRGLSPEEVEAIRAAFLAAPGVRGLHELRTRKMGDLSVIDAHILVDPHISVSEGHFIAEKARASVMKQFHTLDVLVHIDPEDDDLASPSAHLPGREAILAELRRDLGAWLPEDSRIQLHYLDGKVEVDLFLTLPQNFSAAETAALYAGINRLTSSSSFREVRLHTPFNVS